MGVELHNVWITKKILVSGQGKSGHMQSHQLFSEVKGLVKNATKEKWNNVTTST